VGFYLTWLFIYEWHDRRLIRSRNYLPFASTWGTPDLLYVVFFALSYHMSLRTKFLVISVAVSAWKRCSVRICLLLFVGGLVYCLFCLFTCSSVRCMLCFVFVFVFLRFVYSMLSDSLDCPVFIISQKKSMSYKNCSKMVVQL
jgi:hypothetical protein